MLRTHQVGLLIIMMSLLVLPATAKATMAGPAWSVRSVARPTNFIQGDSSGADTYSILVTNIGSEPSDGSPVKIVDTLPVGPTGVSVQSVSGFDWASGKSAGELSCTPATVECIWNGVVPPEDVLEMSITVATEKGAVSPLRNMVSVSGGGAAEVSTSAENEVGTAANVPFAINDFGFDVGGVDGAPDVQAGDHPYAVTTTVDFPTRPVSSGADGVGYEAPESIKDAIVELPLGLVGNPQAVPQCPLSSLEVGANETTAQCPSDTKVGDVSISEPEGFASSLFPQIPGEGTYIRSVSALYNMVPEHGHPAEFGFDFGGVVQSHLYPSVVDTPDGYVLRVTTPNIPAVLFPAPGFVSGFSLTLFGDPDRHNEAGEFSFFTNPANCAASPAERTATVHIDTWAHPATTTNADGTPNFSDPNWYTAYSTLPPVTGCNALQFAPEIEIKPESASQNSPTGAEIDVKIPQIPSKDATLATPDLRDATVTLPAGMSLSPSAANGLQACSERQIGFVGLSTINGSDEFTNSQPSCPEASKIGSVQLTTPLLKDTVDGSVYLAEQDNNPFGSLIALYVVVDDPVTGTLIKLAGEGQLGEGTNGLAVGQVRTSFKNNPQLPFSELKLKLKEGPTAPLVTPSSCGTYDAEALLTPWSAPDSGPSENSLSSFQVRWGPNGEVCSPQGFAPSFTAGTVDNQAGGYSPFTLGVNRSDSDQPFSDLSITLPSGLLAKLADVPQCSEEQANGGECPEVSRIGTVIAGVGPGPDPFYASGKIFLTGSYKGGPFGEAVEVPAVAGPFNLGTVVVRGAIYVNPYTAQATVVSDPFPTMLKGIVLQTRSITVTLERPEFLFNPTNCKALSLSGMLTSTLGETAPVSSHFQVANCASLKFKPSFSAITSGKASKADGASLTVKVSYPNGPEGVYANIGSVKVDLPKQLPSRLTTLQKACIAAAFEANPANCPAASDVGVAIATTPVLAHPLMGPAYIVSHGGEAFPDLEIVLQGEGITLVLVGNTQIKKGITSSIFKRIPDAPISHFELKLPMGKSSILASNLPVKAKYSFCGQTLLMPTAITSQNGAVIKQTTIIPASGCTKIARHERKKTYKKRRR